jgi:hypothetical protein
LLLNSSFGEDSKKIFSCDFNNSNNKTACNGEFNFLTNGNQEAGVFKSSNTVLTELGYDLTDYTSISKRNSFDIL